MAIIPKDCDRKGWTENRLWNFLNKGSAKHWGGYADFGTFKVYDKDVAKYVKKHLRFVDRFNIHKITESVLLSFSILSGSCEPPAKGDNWKF